MLQASRYNGRTTMQKPFVKDWLHITSKQALLQNTTNKKVGSLLSSYYDANKAGIWTGIDAAQKPETVWKKLDSLLSDAAKLDQRATA